MTEVCIGIHPHEQPDQLRATIESVCRNTPESVQLILLPDGPDGPMSEALAHWNDIPQFSTAEPCGAAACFNRLAGVSTADVVVLLESGCQVGPGWLDHLLVALDSGERNGLAGPTTNYAWNEQCVYWGSTGSPEEIASTAEAAAARFGPEVRRLEPLYSLADFCYAVRREVIDEIGAADEAYGLGPCWEMDYNIRAARAGWHSVWACAAYVYRAPFTARRRLEEERRFEASKHRYQDKFCGARLRGEKTDYRSHCRGDQCPNFAPAQVIEIRKAFSPVPVDPLQSGDESIENFQVAPQQLRMGDPPLVSCIMPTSNRRSLVPQAIRGFLRQDYPNLELIVVDDGTDAVANCMPADKRVRYFRLNHRLTVGAKRNFACDQARGAFIAHWDDDDWYPASRISTQVKAIDESSDDICGSSRIYFYQPASDKAWEYCYSAGDRPWVGGTTLLYRQRAWKSSPFPDLQIGEDSHFVCYGSDKKICDLAAPDLCVGMVHTGNTSYKETDGSFWRPHSGSDIQELLRDDLETYQVLLGDRSPARWPLVTCIMPTYNRRSFARLALQCFAEQDYPNKELIVLDDGEDQIGDLAEGVTGIEYIALSSHLSIGGKRNLACARARGEVIVHWDDDDWYAPERLRYQVKPILRGEADITGLENAFVLDLPRGHFWTTAPELHRKMFFGDVHGGTIAYHRRLVEQGLRYPDLNLAEDAWLLHQAIAGGKRLLRLANRGAFVYIRHGGNAWRECEPGRFLDPQGWSPTTAPAMFPACLLTELMANASALQIKNDH